MTSKKPEKINKNLYLPTWICEMLDIEGDRYDGPGVVAAASINAFCSLDQDAQIEALEAFRGREIKEAYSQDIGEERAAEMLFNELGEMVKKTESGVKFFSPMASIALGQLLADLGPEYIADCQAAADVAAAEAGAKVQRRKKRPGPSKSA